MASSLTSPTPEAQPASPGTDMGAYAGVLGGGQGAPVVDDAEQLRREQMQNLGMQVRRMTQQLDGMAQQYPAVASDIRSLQRGLTMLQVKIVGSQQSESQPPTGQMG